MAETKNVGKLVQGTGEQVSTALSTLRYPSEIDNRDISSITNSPSYEDGSWRMSKGYEFDVVRVNESGGVIQENAGGFKTYRLQINPQELKQDEIFAIQVTPTFRGVLVEHQGVTLKDITMSGTTGISPGNNTSGFFSSPAVGAKKKSDGSPVLSSGQSGYKEFHELRSYFRAYVEAKRVDAEGTLRMVFRNLKDAELLFVEPQKFSMKRSARRSTLYDYEIVLKGIGVAERPKALGGYKKSTFKNLLETAQDALDKIKYAADVISGAVDYLNKLVRDIEAAILGPLKVIQDFLEAVLKGVDFLRNLKNITKNLIKKVKDALRKIKEIFNDIIGKNNENYDNATGRTPVESDLPPEGREPTFEELEILNAIQQAESALNILLANKGFFEQDVNSETDDIAGAYTKRRASVTDDGSVLSDIANPDFSIQKPNSIRTITITGDETIQTIAARELGNPDRFKEIVVLNNLKPPYISDTPGPNVLSSGSTIKIPQSSPEGQSSGVLENFIFNITRQLSQLERNLGVDLRINEDNDLAISNTGDLSLVAGTTNMAQSILIKLGLDVGSLKRHAEIGAGLKLGVKAVPTELEKVRGRILSSLSTDGRIESVPFLQLRQEGGTTFIDMVVKLKNLNQPVPIPLVL